MFKLIEYGKCSKISDFSFSILNLSEHWLLRAGIHIMVVRIAIREDPDRTASEEAV